MKNYLSRRHEGNDGFMDVWNDPFEDFFKPFFYGGVAASEMRTDVKTTEKGYEMQVDLPGFDKQDIQVTLKAGERRRQAQLYKARKELFLQPFLLRRQGNKGRRRQGEIRKRYSDSGRSERDERDTVGQYFDRLTDKA